MPKIENMDLSDEIYYGDKGVLADRNYTNMMKSNNSESTLYNFDQKLS